MCPRSRAYAVGTNNWQALWLWNRTNVFAATPGPSVSGTVAVAGLNSGTYSGTWWDTFGAGAVSNFTFTVTSSSVPVTLPTPPILRSLALYVGIPAHAGIVAPEPEPDRRPQLTAVQLALGDNQQRRPAPGLFAVLHQRGSGMVEFFLHQRLCVESPAR